jgi:hypothetical protein
VNMVSGLGANRHVGPGVVTRERLYVFPTLGVRVK